MQSLLWVQCRFALGQHYAALGGDVTGVKSELPDGYPRSKCHHRFLPLQPQGGCSKESNGFGFAVGAVA
eukprot:gene14917-biopygen20148